MSDRTITCPNASCGAPLKFTSPPAPGKQVRCPRCGTAFKPAADVGPATDTPIRLAPEAEGQCPSCQVVLAPGAVLCVSCGFNLRTGQKVEGAKKARKKRSARAQTEAVSEDDLPALLHEADTLIELAHKELWRVPRVLGLGDDPDDQTLARGTSHSGRCSNPNCRMGLEGGHLSPGLREGTSRVKIRIRYQTVYAELCEACTEMLLADLESRKGTARAYLGEARTDLERAARRFPRHPDIREALMKVRAVEKLAREPWFGGCFIATAAFGGPFAAEVATLRRFRDEVLTGSAPGRLLVRVYEAVAPPVAARLEHSPWGRAAVRALLRPVAALCRRRLDRKPRA